MINKEEIEKNFICNNMLGFVVCKINKSNGTQYINILIYYLTENLSVRLYGI